MRAIWRGVTVAESTDTRVVEGNHYFPAESVRAECLEDSDTRTTCGWKGEARYKTLVAAGERNPDAAWFYPAPKPAAEEIRDRIAFWRGVEIVD